jgi:ABC-type antimicrobial peptide transport system permease subunit
VRAATWIAAVGVAVLALLGVGMTAVAGLHARRGEVVVLRAVGLSARQQSAARLREVLSVVGLAVLFGLLSGAAVSWLTIVGLAKSAVVGVPPGLQGTLQVALVAGGGLLAAAIVVMLLIALRSSSRVRHQALDTDERLETR